MSNVLVFTSSGREYSIGTQLAKLAAQGHNATYYDLTRAKFSGCTGCRQCRTEDFCPIDDELTAMYRKILDCDSIIVAMPIYFSGIAGQAKLWLDRLYPMVDAEFHPRHPGKNILVIYTQGDPNAQSFSPAIASTNYAFRMFGWNIVDSIVCAGTAAPDYEIPQELLRRVEAAREKL